MNDRPDAGAALPPDMMELVQFSPPTALAPFVTQIYFFRCDRERVCDILPAAPGHLIFLLKGAGTMRFQDGHVDAVTKASVIGPGLGALEFQMDGPLHDLGFALSPLGFVALIGRSANHYVDRAVPASSFFGSEINDLMEKFVAGHADGTIGLAQMVDEISRFLLARVKPVPAPHVHLVQTVIGWLSSHFEPDVEQLYAQGPMSRSTTVRVITKYFGSAPKPLMRKYRALRAATIMVDPRASDQLREHVESLFYDQPHMIREIRHFTGRTPGALDSNEAKLMRLWLNRDNFRDIQSFVA
jgi:AraC-like DNA-binding protein